MSAANVLWTFLLTLLSCYHVLVGGTFRGSLTGEVKVWNQVLFGALVVGVVIATSGGRLKLPMPPMSVHVLLLAVAWEGLGSLLSSYPRLSLEVWLTRVWYVAALYAAFVYCSSHERRLSLCAGLLIAATVALVVAGFQFADWVGKPGAAGTIHDQRQIVSTLNHSNDFACHLGMMIPLAMGLFATRSFAMIMRLGAMVVTAAALFFLGLTLSRSGWLGAAAAMLVFFAGSIAAVESKDRARVVAGIVVFTLIAVFSFRLPSTAVNMLSRSSATPTPDWQQARMGAVVDYGFTQRLVFWKAMARMVQARPLVGWGDGMLALIYPRFADRAAPNELPFHAHNVFIQPAVEGGLPCALLYMVGGGWILVQSIRAVKRLQAGDRPLVVALCASIVGYSVCGIGQANQATPCIHVVPMLLLGALARASVLTVGRMTQEVVVPARVGDAVPVQVRWLALVIGIGIAAAVYAFVLDSVRKQREFDEGIVALNSGNPSAISHLGRAARDSHNAPYRAAWGLAIARLKNDPQSAALQLRAAIDAFPHDPVFHHNLAWLLMKQRVSMEEARRELQVATQLDPARPGYWLSLAEVERRLGDDPSVEKHLRAAAAIRPPQARAQWVLAQHLFARGDRQEALRYASIALDRWDNVRHGLHIRVRYYRKGPDSESLDELPAIPSRQEIAAKIAKWRATE